ncbi:MAG: VTT domain-containing protein [Parcubacteria group bacterium]|nr:VTT domain-containing protein [Parcubacteria group bacterium]
MFGFDLVGLIKAVGYLGLFGIIFAESGLLIGFFLPGDSLLFTAGFLASQGFLDIGWLMAITFTGAVLGDSFGYAFGRKVGHRIFKREDSFLFHRDNLERAQKFYQAHGGKAIIMARFLPVVRTFAPILAGIGKMRYGTFLSYNVAGGFLWAVGLSWLGYWLGNTVPNIDKYLVPLILVIVIASMLPSIIHILKNKTHRRQIAEFLKSKLKL